MARALTVLLILLVAPGAAEAATVDGSTTLTTSKTINEAFAKRGVKIRTGAGAKSVDGAYSFHVLRGRTDDRFTRVELEHNGSFAFSHGHRKMTLRGIEISTGSHPVVYARLNGSHRATRMGLLTARTTVRMPRRTALFSDLRVSRDFARALSEVAGRRVLASGARFGSVMSAVCRTGHCVPGKTDLGTFPILAADGGAAGAVAEANALHLQSLRQQQPVEDPIRDVFGVFAGAGKSVVTTVRTHPVQDGTGHNPSRPPVTPPEVAAYGANLDRTLAGLRTTSLVMVENEEIAPIFYSGSMAQYLTQLRTAVAVAHRRALPATNGGITSVPVALLTWRDLKARGLDAAADDYARRAFNRGGSDRRILADLLRRPFTGFTSKFNQAAYERARQLIAGFRTSEMDYVDFHWYHSDAKALGQTIAYLQRVTGKPAVTTEIGQYDTSPKVVDDLLEQAAHRDHLPVVTWFDSDGRPALGLHSSPGVLRPNGLAFRAWVDRHRRYLR